MCHAFLYDARFHEALRRLDHAMAAEVQAGGCPFCGGSLHRGDYPRKPRALRSALSQEDSRRLSLCCAREGCRRRCTPPSVRFLGRKVYLGLIIALASALSGGLSSKRRAWLCEQLAIPAQTLWRWQGWWRTVVPQSTWWGQLRGELMPPVRAESLPGGLLERLQGADLPRRLRRLLWLLRPLTTTSWTGTLRAGSVPQKM